MCTPAQRELVWAYTQMKQNNQKQGWECHLVTKCLPSAQGLGSVSSTEEEESISFLYGLEEDCHVTLLFVELGAGDYGFSDRATFNQGC